MAYRSLEGMEPSAFSRIERQKGEDIVVILLCRFPVFRSLSVKRKWFCLKGSVREGDFVLTQKRLTEQRLVDLLPVRPEELLRRFRFHFSNPPSCRLPPFPPRRPRCRRQSGLPRRVCARWERCISGRPMTRPRCWQAATNCAAKGEHGVLGAYIRTKGSAFSDSSSSINRSCD